MLNTWLVVAAALVFFMQAGFLCLETGLVRDKNVKSVAFKNLIDTILVVLVFVSVGFAFMFGKGQLIGFSFFGLEGLPEKPGAGAHLFALYQLGFATTATTIVSGAIAGRAAFLAYVYLALAVGAVIYPVFGHWAWGDLLVSGHGAWLSKLGFVDFAGSTVVHSLGGWVGLVAAVFVGPRLGRFDKNEPEFRAHSYGLAALGVLILWFGWFGFNGGSVGERTALVGPVILNTCVAGAAAGLAGYAHAVVFQDCRVVPAKLAGATLAGLVAVTACCHVLRPWTAMCVGIVAGALHNWSFEWLARKRIDDAVGVFPVHGVGGMWGTVAVGVFGRADLLPLDRISQIGVQLLGIGLCAAWATGASYLVLLAIRATVGMRVSPEEELEGVSVAGEFRAAAAPSPDLSEAEILALLEEHE